MIYPKSSLPTGACRLLAGLAATVGMVLSTALPAQAIVSTTPVRTPTFNGTVWATAYAGDVVYLGGDFTAALVSGRQVPRARLAAVNARTGALLDWAPSADGQVRAIATSGGAVYVAGQFGTVNGARRDSLARLDGSSGALHATFRHTILGTPYALATGSGRLYLGGSVTAVGGQRRSRLAAFSLATGALDPAWKPTADDQVEALAATTNRIYVGGKFDSVNGVSGSRRIAAVNPATGAVVSGFKARTGHLTYGLAVTSTAVYAAHGGQGGRVIAYGLDGARRWTLTTDGDTRAVAALDGLVYIGGHFDNVCRSTRTGDQGRCLDGNVRRVKLAVTDDRGQVQAWTANGNGVIGVLCLTANPRLGLAVGGAFTAINDKAQKRFAVFR